MTQIILRNDVEPVKLDILLAFLNSCGFDAEIDTTTAGKKKVKKETSLTLSVGLWEGRDVNDKQLREKAWGTNKRLAK
ncbi:hypothetical protein FACS1894181_16970 [Bacteroidia bacterium]|nr:hypothetical protein FACS1894181_16970 [Bacteroidia bacterium]